MRRGPQGFVNRLTPVAQLSGRRCFADQHWLFAVKLGHGRLELAYFGQVEASDIGLPRMKRGVVLVVLLSRVKSTQGRELRHDLVAKYLGRVKLRDIALGNLLLCGTAIEN